MGLQTFGALTAIAVIAALTLGCCKGKSVGSGPSRQVSTEREVSKDELAKEIARVTAGEDVGSQLLTPSIVVDSQGVSVNGTIVLDAILPKGTPAPIAALRRWIKADRDHWRALHPSRPFKGTATVKIDPSLDAVAGLSTVHTICSAGFAQDVTVGDTRFSAAALERSPSASAWLQRPGANGIGLKFEGHRALPLAEMPIKDEADLRRNMGEVCTAAEPPCFEMLVVDPGTGESFGALARWMAAALDASVIGKANPTVLAAAAGKVLLPIGLMTNTPGDASPWGRDETLPPRPDCDASKFKSKVRIGAIAATGALDAPRISSVVEAQMEALSTCYNAGRCRSEDLTGRVSVGFTILSNGQTTSLRNAGADVPDVEMVRCVVDVFHKARFPQGEGTTHATVPLVFQPR